jgi:hypothetical protein
LTAPARRTKSGRVQSGEFNEGWRESPDKISMTARKRSFSTAWILFLAAALASSGPRSAFAQASPSPAAPAPAAQAPAAPAPAPAAPAPSEPAAPAPTGEARAPAPKPKPKPRPPAPPRETALSDDPAPVLQPETFFTTSKASERYAQIVDLGGWPKIGVPLKPGAKSPAVALLRRRLAAEDEIVTDNGKQNWDPALT